MSLVHNIGDGERAEFTDAALRAFVVRHRVVVAPTERAHLQRYRRQRGHPQALTCTSTIKSEDCEMCKAIADYWKQLGKATNETPVSKPTKGVKK